MYLQQDYDSITCHAAKDYTPEKARIVAESKIINNWHTILMFSDTCIIKYYTATI